MSINKGTRALLLDNLDTATTRGQLLIDDQKKHCEPHTQQVDIEQLWTVLACLIGCGLLCPYIHQGSLLLLFIHVIVKKLFNTSYAKFTGGTHKRDSRYAADNHQESGCQSF